MYQKNTISEAPESNAGDNFHVLWAIKKSFNLLNFEDDGLKAIVIEGIDPKEESALNPEGTELLGIDITEYFGGENFSSAQKVVVSQLKYSTRQSEKNWTFSDLYKSKKKDSIDGSIIHRLAQIYKVFLDKFGRDLVLRKLSLKFISNRNFNDTQKEILNIIKNNKNIVIFNDVLSQVKTYQNGLLKIFEATKLSSIEFVDFLRLLDFEDCGTDSNYYQELEIVEVFRNWGFQNSIQQDSLFRMVWRKMLPPAIAAGQNKITEIDLLFSLQTSMDRLFPVPSKFDDIENLVEREQVNTLIHQIINNDTGNPICLHGVAGIGKSTITQSIKKDFPKSSEVILFDCYGAGKYLNPSDNRHLHKEAIPQICNEMAKKIGSAFLLSFDKDTHILIKELKRRVEEAVVILQKRDANSVLVLIVDAADNSVTAAQKNKTKSFIQDLVNENFVNGFRLVVTSRSHRIPSINLPTNYIDIPLVLFDYEETKNHLTFYFPKSTKEEIDNFHILTHGIPRVQVYSLDFKKKGIKEIINYLKPNGKKVEDLIYERIIEATKKLGGNGESIVDTFFTYLICLPRPVPLSYISILTELSKELIQDLSIDIWHGLILINNELLFRDEDFENYIRQKYKPTEKVYKNIADLFLEKAETDEYASVNLGVALFEAKYTEKLKNIVLNEEYKSLPTNPIRKKHVFTARTKLAMKVCNKSDDNLAFFKLAFIAAEAAKTDRALNELLIQNADLVASFGESDSLQKLYLQSEEKPWAGSFHYQLAAIYSRNNNLKELAKKHLNTAEKWMDWRERQNKTNKRNYIIHPKDIAYGTEAYLRLFGSQTAFDWITDWYPKETLFESTEVLIKQLFDYSSKEQISKWLQPLNLPIYAKLLILKRDKYLTLKLFNLEEIANKLILILSKGIKFKEYLLSYIILFCEIYSYSNDFNKEKIRYILTSLEVKLPYFIPSFVSNSYLGYNETASLDSFLRNKSLEASINNSNFKLEDLYPEEYNNLEGEKDAKKKRLLQDKKRKFDRFYKYAIEIYQFRVNAIINKNSYQNVLHFDKICKSIKGDSTFRYEEGHLAQYKLNFLASKLIEGLQYMEEGNSLIESVIKSFDNENQNSINLRIVIANKIYSIEKFRKNTYKIINDVDLLIQEMSIISRDIIDYYIQFSRLFRSIDKGVSKIYFDKAINAISEIGLEAHDQIKCLFNLSTLGITKANPHLAFEFARFIEFCKSRLDGFDHFPLEDGIKGIGYLDMPTVFAVICRWSHRYITDITGEISSILAVALERDFITPTVGSSLLPLDSYCWKSYIDNVKVLIEKYDIPNNSIQKNNFVKKLLKDIQIQSNYRGTVYTFKEIYSHLNTGKYLSQETLTVLNEYNDFFSILETIEKSKNSTPSNLSNAKKIEQKLKLEIKDIDITSTTSLSKAIKKIKSTKEDYFIQSRISQFFKKIKTLCTINDYVPHLNAIIDIDTGLISLSTFEEVIKERLEDWDFYPLVSKWKKQNFNKALKLWFSNFNWNDGIHYDGIIRFANVFSVENSELSEIIFDILPEKIEELSASAFYQTITFLRNRLSKAENENLITWILPRWNSKIKDDFSDGIWNDKLAPSNSPSDIIAQTIRFTLGHPDTRTRWRGVHALRRLVNSGNISILKTLLIQQNNTTCHPFQHKDYTYFWISAKLYLWICIARLSEECPNKLHSFKDIFLQEAQNEELPHVLILSFIKQTCLNIHKDDNAIFSKQEVNVINGLLVSKLPYRQYSESEEQEKSNSNKKEQLRYEFNFLNTLPYWYAPLGRPFNLSQYDVAFYADKYISEKWGYIGDAYKDNHVKTPPYESYHLTMNEHGNLPVIENLELYYEYHAMYCAASEILKNTPLEENESYDWYTWEHWLKSQNLTWTSYWLSDLRDPTPLMKRFWIKEYNSFDKKWKENISDELYDEVIGLSSNPETQNLFLYGNYTIYFGENYESTSIRSALVSTKSSKSLLRALQTTYNNHDYKIPLEDDSLQFRKQDGFQLLGWLKDVRSESEGLDKNDSFGNEESNSYILLGKEVERLFEINYSKDCKLAFYNEKKIFSYKNWSNVSKHKSSSNIESEGSLLEIDVIFLLEFLQKRNMSLIVECTITRELKEKDYSFNRLRKNNAKLYLINSNGEVKTVRGRNYQIG